LRTPDEQDLAAGVVGVDLRASSRTRSAMACSLMTTDSISGGTSALRLDHGAEASRAPSRRARTPPGSATGPCPCQSSTSARSASTWRGGHGPAARALGPPLERAARAARRQGEQLGDVVGVGA
jgi:hypothetical protein